jgi:hypothetical protein
VVVALFVFPPLLLPEGPEGNRKNLGSVPKLKFEPAVCHIKSMGFTRLDIFVFLSHKRQQYAFL